MININLRDVEKIIAKKEKEGITFKEAAESYAEAHVCEELRMPELTDEQLKRLREEMERQPIHIEPDSPVRPLPCVRDEHGAIKEQTVKQLFAKINEELDELKGAIFPNYDDTIETTNIALDMDRKNCCGKWRADIVEEAADTITAITTMLESLGIDAAMRDETQRRVNDKNRERGRL